MYNKKLLHFTGRGRTDQDAYCILKIIINTSELLMSHCPTFGHEKFERKFMMACLADPEKVDIVKHQQLFGKFAVAFNRDSMMKYGANPVLYITSENLVHIESQIKLLEKLEDLNRDRGWREDFEPYQFTEDEFLSFYFTTGLSQEMQYKGEKDNYFQSEWRILYHPDRFLGDGKEYIPGMIRPSSLNGKHVGYLKFCNQDISYILVPREFVDQAKKDFPHIKVETA
ncbi:abortive infection system antitoxin AbiGi family protein [Delftia tsuruhatensis]|uniref:abortive infection system antitoxin AbiGi family protein n=1 Tax=Delftia tsuruhatensis TaxID=180282 RepID=UPI002260E054|nr:abortive infection system antitoxin AbiGi family protein [Delftia tsuruhatensis]MCX7507651.1 abortive infection system antitoxin AbiGi family protein [Delftia tsuruhatensis]